MKQLVLASCLMILILGVAATGGIFGYKIIQQLHSSNKNAVIIQDAQSNKQNTLSSKQLKNQTSTNIASNQQVQNQKNTTISNTKQVQDQTDGVGTLSPESTQHEEAVDELSKDGAMNTTKPPVIANQSIIVADDPDSLALLAKYGIENKTYQHQEYTEQYFYETTSMLRGVMESARNARDKISAPDYKLYYQAVVNTANEEIVAYNQFQHDADNLPNQPVGKFSSLVMDTFRSGSKVQPTESSLTNLIGRCQDLRKIAIILALKGGYTQTDLTQNYAYYLDLDVR